MLPPHHPTPDALFPVIPHLMRDPGHTSKRKHGSRPTAGITCTRPLKTPFAHATCHPALDAGSRTHKQKETWIPAQGRDDGTCEGRTIQAPSKRLRKTVLIFQQVGHRTDTAVAGAKDHHSPKAAQAFAMLSVQRIEIPESYIFLYSPAASGIKSIRPCALKDIGTFISLMQS